MPLLWDGQTGDSRVPGFAAAAKFGLGVAQKDAALQAEGLADLEAAVAVNAFFNVFDLIPVVQALPATDPRFAQVFPLAEDLHRRPEHARVRRLPAGDLLRRRARAAERRRRADALRRRLREGEVTRFRERRPPHGTSTIRSASGPARRRCRTTLFADALAERAGPGKAAARAALYQDADPTNDPPIIGAGPQACAVCHYR